MNPIVTKIKKLSLIFFILGIFQACKKENIPKPQNLIPEKDMPTVLVDVHMAEESVKTFKLELRDSIAKQYYAHIFRIHELEEEQFYQSIDYYSKKPEELRSIYHEVTEILAEKDKKEKAEKSKAPH